jgi:general secretion pathway protein C
MFKHYLWVVHFLLLPLGAYLVADMVNLVIGSKLEASIKPVGEDVSPSFSNVVSRKSDLNSIITGNIFNANMRGKEEATPAPQAEVIQAPPPDLRITLIGTVVGEGDTSYAIIENQMTREQILYRLGELIDNQARITQIDRDEVVLLMGDTQRRLRLYLEEEEPGPGTTGTTGAATPQQGGVVKVTPNQWVLDRQEIAAALDNLPQLLTKARVVPNFSAGKPDGFRIFSIVPDSFFSKIGLQNGDVLQRINGVEVKDPENFMKVFQQLKGETSVTLDLVRNNQKQTFAYEIR